MNLPAVGSPTRLRLGYEFCYTFPQPTPMILTLSVHYSRASDLAWPDNVISNPSVPVTAYRDLFGNWCSRLVAPAGKVRISADTIIKDSGAPDALATWAEQLPVQSLPQETLVFLLGSRYCETDLLTEAAWSLFSKSPSGWARVQAICDFVHQHITFGYQHADPKRTAWQVFNGRVGVCRDYAHLAVALCRCMNIPARYCTGYVSDIGETPPFGPMDFAGWFEAFLGGQWYTFDPRNNTRRRGRVLIARGRDAADVALNTTFGPNTLDSFRVWADEVPIGA